MRIEGEHVFRASRQRVWDLLQSPDAVRRALPGVERFEPAGPDSFEATMRIGVAAVRGTYHGRITMTDLQPPERYTLTVRGQGSPGTIEATAEIALAEQDGETRLRYTADARVGGLIAGVGQRMLAGVAGMTARQFFKAIDEQLVAASGERRDGAAAARAEPNRDGGDLGPSPTGGGTWDLTLLDVVPEAVVRLVPAGLAGALVGFLLGHGRRLGSARAASADLELAAAIRDLAEAIRSHRAR